MAIIKLSKDLFENVSMVARPHRTYISSSDGSTGELTLSARPSERIGEISEGRVKTDSNLLYTHVNEILNEPPPPDSTEAHHALNRSVNAFIFDGTSVLPEDEIDRQPSLFKSIQDDKQRRIADTKKLYISASFFDPDVFVGKGTTFPPNSNGPIVLNVTYDKLDTNPSSLLPDRDKQLIEYNSGISEEPGSKSFLLPGKVPKEDTVSSITDANRKLRALKWHYRGNESIRNNHALRYVKDVLMEKYKSRYDHCEYSYSNFQCLNFLGQTNFTNSDAVLVYPNTAPYPGLQFTHSTAYHLTASGGPYSVNKEMTIDFWINPKYDNATPGSEFKHGTILHHSGAYAVSLISGSFLDSKKLVDSYRILLQIGSSAANKRPSMIDLSSLSTGEFVTPDGILRKNHWHRVTISVDTSDNIVEFKIDESVIKQDPSRVPSVISDRFSDGSIGHAGQLGLFVGNYFDGKYDQVRNFFSANISDREGFFEADSITDHRYENKIISSDADADISDVSLNYPLCAEIHDIKIYKKKLSDTELKEIKSEGVRYDGDGSETERFERLYYPEKSRNPKLLAFYLPVFFNPRCRIRKVLTSPFEESADRPYTPTNSNFSMGIGGKLVNLENYVMDYAQGNLPRLYHLTESVTTLADNDIDIVTDSFQRVHTKFFTHAFEGSTGQESQIAAKGRIARNLMVLPCDNGLANINYDCLHRHLRGHTLVRENTGHWFIGNHSRPEDLSTLDFSKSKNANIQKRMTNELNNFTIDKVSLRNFLTKSFSRTDEEGNVAVVPTTGDRAEFFPISHVLQNVDSRDVTLFAVPSIFYGERIHPETLRITSDSVTGSRGMMSITVKDNGKGSLYRADALTPHAKHVTVGNVFYDEGLILYKSPHPLCFGKEGFTFDFKGEHTVHSLQINAPCPEGLIFSSSNPTYQFLSASSAPQDQNNNFVYITDINIHDDNLNVIMKASLSQPVLKRDTDSFMFKLRQDF